MSILQVTADEVARLDDGQLHVLLNRLLLLEAKHFGIPLRSVHHTCPERIMVGDGGQDLRMEWEDGPDQTDFCPRRTVVFQAKATPMTGTDCQSEVTNKDGTLKPKVLEVLENGGAYIIVCNKFRGREHRADLEKAVEECIQGTLKGIKDAGWDKFEANGAKVDFYDVEALTNWVNQYYSVVQWVKEQIGAQHLDAFTYDLWAGNTEIHKNEFVQDEENDKLRSDLLRLISVDKARCKRGFKRGISASTALQCTFGCRAFRNQT